MSTTYFGVTSWQCCGIGDTYPGTACDCNGTSGNNGYINCSDGACGTCDVNDWGMAWQNILGVGYCGQSAETECGVNMTLEWKCDTSTGYSTPVVDLGPGQCTSNSGVQCTGMTRRYTDLTPASFTAIGADLSTGLTGIDVVKP